MRCPHCGKLINAATTNSAADPGINYDERNPPPPGIEAAPPAEFMASRGQAAQSHAIDVKYHELSVYIEAESEKALLCSDAAPGDKETFKDWFPKSQLKSQSGAELSKELWLNWKGTYQNIQFSEWILKKKEVSGF